MDQSKSIPANRIPLAQRFKKLREGLASRVSTEHSEEKHEVENHSTLDGGNEIGNVKTKDGKVVEQQASVDMQNTGEDEKALKRAGGKDAKVVRTAPTRAAEQATDEHDEASESKGGDTPKESQESEEVDMFASSESKQTGGSKTKEGKADKSLFSATKGSGGGTQGEEGSFKAKGESRIKVDDSQSADKSKGSEKSGGKPDKSMSKMASQTSAKTQGAPDLTKSELAKARVDAGKSHDDKLRARESRNYRVSRGNGNVIGLPKDDIRPRTVHVGHSKGDGTSRMGRNVAAGRKGLARTEAENTLDRMRDQPRPNLEKADAPKDPTGMPSAVSQNYKIEAKPGEITYTKGPSSTAVTQKPKWKQDWDKKTPTDKAKFRAKLSADKAANREQQMVSQKPGQKTWGKSLEDKYMIGRQAEKMDKTEESGWRRLFKTARMATGSAALAKAGPAGPAGPGAGAPDMPKPAAPKQNKMDEKKQKLIQMARMGQERPLTSTPLGHALANYTDPNSFSYDARFAAMIMRMNPNWAKK